MAGSGTGKTAVLQVSASGDFSAPVYVEVTIAKDVSTSKETEKLEDDCRGSADDNYKRYIPGMKDISTSLEVCHRTSHAAWELIVNAEDTDDILEVQMLDGPEAPAVGETTEGIRYMANVFSFEMDQPLNSPLNDSFEFAPTACQDTLDKPERVTIVGS